MEDVVKALLTDLSKSEPYSRYQQFVYKNRFAGLKTNLDRINYVYTDMEKYSLFPQVETDVKDDSVAIKHRENGNKKFKSGNYLGAIDYYTRSIATAKTDTILALAYANRATCLHKLKMYQACITDTDRAFANNYSGERKEQLITRRKQAEKSSKTVENYHEEVPEIPDSDQNPLIQSASSCVKIEQNEEFGRHVVATRDIQIGDVISVEKAFACVLTRDELVHCHECLELCYNLIPCKNCTEALYCGEECRDKALNKYHNYECPILLSITKLKINCILTALKIAILARSDYQELNKFQFTLNEYYRSDRYKEIHNLLAPVRRTFDYQFFMKTAAAAVVCYWIKTKTNFFQNQKMENTFKELILLQLQITSVNGLNIHEIVPAPDLICYEENGFAGGIYAFSSLYNHSCSRNVYRICYGSTVVIRALNTIKKGEQCFINYGCHYDISSRVPRQLHLNENFLFTCNCKACEEDWEKNVVAFWQALNLSFHSREAATVGSKMATADVNFGKKYLPRFITALKEHEHSEPHGKALTLKKMVSHCFEVLGNKRRLV